MFQIRNLQRYSYKEIAEMLETTVSAVKCRILKGRKLGFGVPIAEWLRKQMKDCAYQVLLDNKATKRGYFKPQSIKQLLDEHSLGQVNHASRIWSLLNLELWHQKFIDS